MEELLEKYENSAGEKFNIYVSRQFNSRDGDKSGLLFRIISVDKEDDYWWCEIYISGTLKKIWGINKRLRKSSIELGLIKIKIAIEKQERFKEHVFTSDNSQDTFEEEIESLNQKLEKIVEKSTK